MELLKGAKPISCKCVFKTKRDLKGNVEKYKAYFISKGFIQKDDTDYKDIFSPVSQKSLGIIMTLVPHYEWT